MVKRNWLYRVEGLLCDERTGRFVASKLAVSTGYLSALIWFNYHNYKSGFNAEEWLIFLAAAGVLKAAEKIIGMKYASSNGSIPTETPYNSFPAQGDGNVPCKCNSAS
jgi:hypothetical protein